MLARKAHVRLVRFGTVMIRQAAQLQVVIGVQVEGADGATVQPALSAAVLI